MREFLIITGSGPANRKIIEIAREKYGEYRLIQVSYGSRSQGIHEKYYVRMGRGGWDRLDTIVGNGRVAGVVNRYDSHILLAGKISERYEAPGTRYKDLLKFKHKGLFHKYVVAKAGHEVRPETEAAQASEVEGIVRSRKLPVVVKPAFGVKSRGIYVIRKVEDLEKAYSYWENYFDTPRFFRDYKNKREILIEEYLENTRMVSATCFVDKRGELKIIEYVDVYRGLDVGQEHMQLVYRVAPSAVRSRVRREVRRILTNIVEGSGLRGCFLHPEFLIRERQVYIVELNVRIGGFRKEIAWYRHGIDLDKINIDLSTGREVELDIHNRMSVTAAEVWEEQSGKVVKVGKPESEYLKDFRQLVGDGEEYTAPPRGDKPLSVFYIVKKNDSLKEAMRVRNSIKNEMK